MTRELKNFLWIILSFILSFTGILLISFNIQNKLIYIILSIFIIPISTMIYSNISGFKLNIHNILKEKINYINTIVGFFGLLFLKFISGFAILYSNTQELKNPLINSNTNTLSIFILIVIIAPIFEELYFRKIPILVCNKKIYLIPLQILFGLFHGLNVANILIATISGIYLLYINKKYGYKSAVIIHSLSNLIPFIFLFIK